MTWPPRWTEPQFKKPQSAKVDRFLRRTKRDAAEQVEKRKVRNRDKYCRFPLCGCGKMKLRTDVSHSQHKGMGGNPAEDRSKAHLMVLVCGARHKDNIAAIDRGNIRWRPLTARGSNGPIAWDLHVTMIGSRSSPAGDRVWRELAVETAPHVYKPFTNAQADLLKWLSEMTV